MAESRTGSRQAGPELGSAEDGPGWGGGWAREEAGQKRASEDRVGGLSPVCTDCRVGRGDRTRQG